MFIQSEINQMKLAKFTYTDAKQRITQRKVLIQSEPSNKYSGIDVSDFSAEEISSFALYVDSVYVEYLNKLEALKVEFDIKHNYRQFLETNMSNVEITQAY